MNIYDLAMWEDWHVKVAAAVIKSSYSLNIRKFINLTEAIVSGNNIEK